MHDQQFEALANSLVRRVWRGVILPGVGLQFALFVAFSLTLSLSSLLADDDDDDRPIVIVASLPDQGQPPAPTPTPEPVASASLPVPAAPPVAAPATETSATETETETPAPATPAPEKSHAEKSASAEVASSEQVEQLMKKAEAPAEVRELSVEPVLETRPKLPADRPAWVGAANDTSQRIHRLYVASFTADTREAVEAEEMLDAPMVAAVRRYLDETLFPGEGALNLPISVEFVRQNLLDKSTSYVATMATQSGSEYQKWVVLQITPEQRDYLAGQFQEYKQRERLGLLGFGLASALALTGLVNLLFNRRRRRYPDALTPVNMVIMPGTGPGNAGNSPVQYVATPAVVPLAAAAPAAPVVAGRAPRKKRSYARKMIIMCAVIVAVFGFMLPSLMVKTRLHHRPRTQHTRVQINGKVWEFETTHPLSEPLFNDPD